MTGQWDEELLQSLFNIVDVQRILQIPLNSHGFDDFIAWEATKNGKYSVRSGYYLQWKHQFGPSSNLLSLPGGSGLNSVWKIVWKMEVPSKVKIFTWCALHNIIPLKCILINRQAMSVHARLVKSNPSISACAKLACTHCM
jgi:hypothetical protein